MARPPHPHRAYFKNAPEELPENFEEHKNQIQRVAQTVAPEKVIVEDVQYSYGKSVLLLLDVRDHSEAGEKALVAFMTEVQRQTAENPHPLIVTEPDHFWMSAEQRNALRPDPGTSA